MPIRYIVRPGDSVESIAYAHGHAWETLWDEPANSELRGLREEPNILAPGDVVVVPDPRPKFVSRRTAQRHVFRRKSVPSLLRIRLLENDEPRAGLEFALVAGGQVISGVTDSDGWVRCFVMPDVKRAELRLAETGETFALEIGTVYPVDTPSGLQTRLRNLGYDVDAIADESGPRASAALRAFQRDHGLEATGEPDEATRNALVQAHGS